MSRAPMNTATNADVTFDMTVSWYKPEGRGRKFRRQARGLARRLRLPFVRSTIWERDHPEAGRSAASYGPPWISDNALANYSFACTCHKRDRYDRRRGR